MTLCLSIQGFGMERLQPEHRPTSMSVGDIYQGAEKERLFYKDLTRRQNLQRAQSASQQGTLSVFSSSPTLDEFSLPSLSRPTTSTSTLPGHNRPRTSTSLQPWATPASPVIPARMAYSATTLTPHACIRSQSAVDREIEGMVNSLSRQCCDVLGPNVCHQCALIARRENDTLRYEACYQDLHASEENFAKAVLVQRSCPDLTPYQIHTKIARGEISRSNLLELLSNKQQRGRRDPEELIKEMVWRRRQYKAKSIAPDGAAWTFFTNIRDLNEKIVSGRVNRRLLSIDEPAPEKMIVQRQPKSFTEEVCPAFISPKKIKNENPSYITYFDPPLLPKVNQNVSPSFFAGSDKPYELPERLPDKLGSDEIDLGTQYLDSNTPTPTNQGNTKTEKQEHGDT